MSKATNPFEKRIKFEYFELLLKDNFTGKNKGLELTMTDHTNYETRTFDKEEIRELIDFLLDTLTT